MSHGDANATGIAWFAASLSRREEGEGGGRRRTMSLKSAPRNQAATTAADIEFLYTLHVPGMFLFHYLILALAKAATTERATAAATTTKQQQQQQQRQQQQQLYERHTQQDGSQLARGRANFTSVNTETTKQRVDSSKQHPSSQSNSTVRKIPRRSVHQGGKDPPPLPPLGGVLITTSSSSSESPFASKKSTPPLSTKRFIILL